MKRRPKRMLVTAGPTREQIDPIRFISNLSTGLMGYEIAKAAERRGYRVTLISGPTHLVPPKGVHFIPVESSRQMSQTVKANFKNSDYLFMASAVSDWRPARREPQKVKSNGRARSLALVKNPDILYEAGRKKGRRILVGFALESGGLAQNAERKLEKKGLDIIAANKIGNKKTPFGEGLTDVLTITRDKQRKWLKRATKKAVANYLIDKAEELRQA